MEVNNQATHTNMPIPVDERQVKIKIEREVNRLILQKQSENIVAFKEMQEKEVNRKRYSET